MRTIVELYAENVYVKVHGKWHPVGEYLAYDDAPFTPLLDENGLPLTWGEQSKVTAQ